MARVRTSEPVAQAADALSKALSEWLANTNPCDIWQTCVTCYHLHDDGRTCKKFNMIPPAVVVTGVRVCEAYQDNHDIPF